MDYLVTQMVILLHQVVNDGRLVEHIEDLGYNFVFPNFLVLVNIIDKVNVVVFQVLEDKIANVKHDEEDIVDINKAFFMADCI